MKTKMKIFSWFLVLVLAVSAIGAMAENQLPVQTVCKGNEPYHVDETGNPVGTQYMWSIDGNTTGANWVINGNGNSAITVDWNVEGSYTLSVYTIADGCQGETKSVIVTVLPTLSVTITSNNPGPICENSTVLFTANVVNGGANPTYQWFNGTTQISGATDQTYTYTGVAPGAQITCQVTSNDACAPDRSHTAVSNAIDIVVNAQISLSVSIISDVTEICEGGVVTFTATAISGGATVTYQWYNGATLIIGATSATYQYTGVIGGATITCVVDSPDACVINKPATSNPITITVKPKPVTSGIWHN